MFKRRFRDAVTGFFTTKADAKERPAQTVAERASRIETAKYILRRALTHDHPGKTHKERYFLLRNAIDKVLEV